MPHHLSSRAGADAGHRHAASVPQGAAQPRAASRRDFLRLAGGGLVLAAGAPLAGCSASFPAAATVAWQQAGDEPEPRRFMLSHALLAPNPHNRQPWLADLREPDRIHLLCDGDRLLPETDPFGRQILVGCGAFVELAVLAAAQRGIAVTVAAFPDGAPAATATLAGTRVATLVLGAPGSAEPDPLFAQITRRHTAKTAYDNTRTLPEGLAAAWLQTARARGLQAGVVTEAEAVRRLRQLARQGYEIECATDRTWLESARLMRIGPQAIATHRDGIPLNAPMVRALHSTGLFDPMQVPRPGSSNWQRVMDRFQPFETGSGFLWLAGADNSRATQLAAGRAYVRMHLLATAAGADMHPLSQVLQEFPEMRGPYAELHRQLGQDPARGAVQMLARVGHALQPAAATPRRDLASLLRT